MEVYFHKQSMLFIPLYPLFKTVFSVPGILQMF